MQPIRFQKMHDDAVIPECKTQGSAGFDLYADDTEQIDPNYDWATVGTGIQCAIPDGFVGLIWPRSGLATGQGVDTGAGVIDPDYRGELRVLLFNNGDSPLRVEPGDRIAQLVVVPCVTMAVTTDQLDDTERGDAGFGSTGQ